MVLLSIPWWADIGVLGFIIGGLGSVFGIIGIILAVVFYFKPRLPKNEITYRVHSDSLVVSIDEQMEGKVKVFYEDKGTSHLIQKATLLNLEVRNSGKTPVEILNAVEVPEKDPKVPITFTFVGRKVISVTEIKTSDENVIREKNRIDYIANLPHSDSIGLPNCFLKPRQSIILSVLLDGQMGEVKGNGTTQDGSELKSYEDVQQKKNRRRQRTLFSLVSACLLLSILVIILGTLNAVQYNRNTSLSTIPSTLNVTVEIVEDQDPKQPISQITFGFSSNTISAPNTVVFTHRESVSCNNTNPILLGSATSYSVRVAIPYNSWYICDYHYFLHNNPHSPLTTTIFSFHAAQYPLSPNLLRPVTGNFKVSYTPSQVITNAATCTVQVTANVPNQSTSGDTVPQKSNIYTGSNASSLNGSGNIVMTRTCTPINYYHHNNNGVFSAVNVTYISVAPSSTMFP